MGLKKLSTTEIVSNSNHEYESFDKFGSNAYLSEYYSQIDYENNELLKFYAEAYKEIPEHNTLLEFSGGPTIYSLITATSKVNEIHFSDYLKENRKEVAKWIKNHRKAFTWDHFIQRALEHEGESVIEEHHINHRKNLLQGKIKKIVKSNAFRKFYLKHNNNIQYDIVSANFVAESITPDISKWKKAMRNILSLVKDNGYIFLTCLKNSEYYILDGKKFPAVKITEKDIYEVLGTNGFDTNTILLKSIEAEPYRGYEGMIFVRAQKITA